MNMRMLAVGGAVALAAIGGLTYAMLGTASHDTSSNDDSMPGMGGSSSSGGAMERMLPVGDVSGLKRAADGYSLDLETASLSKGAPSPIAFRIVGPGGQAITRFQVDATKKMHLIVVRRDLTNYQHLHPRMSQDGTWTIKAAVAGSGSYRAFADFAAGGKRHVLGVDLTVPGVSTRIPLPEPSTTAKVDGYSVELHAGMLMAGDDSPIRFRITREGRPVRNLERYLGNLGHLVVLHKSTVQYLHVHPTSGAVSGSDIRFSADFPRPGPYRAFLQFQTEGRVHTAEFTIEAHSM